MCGRFCGSKMRMMGMTVMVFSVGYYGGLKMCVTPVGARGDPVHQSNILGVASCAAGSRDSTVASASVVTKIDEED